MAHSSILGADIAASQPSGRGADGREGGDILPDRVTQRPAAG